MYHKYYIVLAVAAFIINKEGKLLIVKKSQLERVDAGLWTVPGGKIHPDEHIFDGLMREVKEEVNLDITDYEWIGEDVFVHTESYFHGEHFLCHILKEEGLVLENSLVDYRWIEKDEIAKYEYHPNIRKAITKIFS